MVPMKTSGLASIGTEPLSWTVCRCRGGRNPDKRLIAHIDLSLNRSGQDPRGSAHKPFQRMLRRRCGLPEQTFGWDVIFAMTEKSWKNKARRHQKANGISYTRARREVDSARTEPDAAGLWSAFGIRDANNLDVGDLWAPHTLRPVPLGLTPDGQPVWLDLNEATAGGHGPHGMLVGKPGSGKTVALQSLVLSLCVLHSPDILQLVLVSGHNGSGLGQFSSYPHVTFASTTADDLDIRRTEQVLTDLITQRVMTLADAGIPNIGAYHRDRTSRPEAELPPMPHVVVVIDECSALLHDRGTAVAISEVLRMGRSLGVHILGAVQKFEMADPAKMVLEGQSTYTIVFKTTAQQSRYLLGSDDAADFINVPGAGMFAILDSDPVAFHAFSPVSNSVIKSVRRQIEKAC